jgi:glycosyltransferase involved in cell wall biosynthesis
MILRAALITPFGPPSVRGNAITVDRIARGLAEQGLDVRVWDLSVTAEATVEAEVATFRPWLVHAFHAYRAGPLALRLARRAETPLVVTITGTDANHDLFDPQRAAVVRRVLEGATSIVVFHESMRRRIAGVLPDVDPRIAVIPQGVRLPRGDPFDLTRWWPLPPERTLFLFPAGIRMVKQPLLPLAPLERLVTRRPGVRLLYVGPILDPEEGEALLRALRMRPWARHAGTQPHDRMWSLLEAADVVINASISEGGMANSVVEAMAAGRPVLASDIDGNRSLVEHGRTGFLFRTEDELETHAERLVDDPVLRRRLGEAGRLRQEELSSPGREVGTYAALYRELVPVSQR